MADITTSGQIPFCRPCCRSGIAHCADPVRCGSVEMVSEAEAEEYSAQHNPRTRAASLKARAKLSEASHD